MSGDSPVQLRILRIGVALVAAFDLFALLVLVWDKPQVFTLFMFLGQPLFLIALLLLVGAVLADLRSKDLV
jgi:hypothetical protein